VLAIAADNWFMTWIKICGMTNLEDALVAVEAGADAVGFVFSEKSPRRVSVETVGPIVKSLPNLVEKVGVFVEQEAEEICEIVRGAGLTAVQAYGDSFAKVGVFAVKAPTASTFARSRFAADKLILGCSAVSVGHLFVRKEVRRTIHSILIDSGSNASPGGTGKLFDWGPMREQVARLSLMLPVIVAGGLSPANVCDAIEILKPWGVDVVSGVEARPGKKDPEKVRAFVRAVREMDRKAT
jgi:phosphoribosylanthranilate isomerase